MATTTTIEAYAGVATTVVVGPYVLVTKDDETGVTSEVVPQLPYPPFNSCVDCDGGSGSGGDGNGFVEVPALDGRGNPLLNGEIGWRLYKEQTNKLDKHVWLADDALDGSVFTEHGRPSRRGNEGGDLIGADGQGAAAFNYNNIAKGRASFAAGLQNIVEGEFSAVFGESCFIDESASSSFAEGNYSTITGDVSYAPPQYQIDDPLAGPEIKLTNIPVQASQWRGLHCEGSFAWNKGRGGAHAEGFYTVNEGKGGAHVEGYANKVGEKFVEMYYSIPVVPSLAAFGGVTTLDGGLPPVATPTGKEFMSIGTHVEGAVTYAEGEGSHAEGMATQAKGRGTHAEGLGCVAQSINIAGGGGSLGIAAAGFATPMVTAGGGGYTPNITLISGGEHAEGVETVANGLGAHSEGYGTTAQGKGAHAGGGDSVAQGDHAFAHGDGATATGNNTIALGHGTGALDDHAVAIGRNAKCYHIGVSLGYGSSMEGYWSAAMGHNAEVAAGSFYSVASGVYARVKSDSTSAFGYNVTTEPGANNSVVLGSSLIAGVDHVYSTLMGYDLRSAEPYQTIIGTRNNRSSTARFQIGIGQRDTNNYGNGLEIEQTGEVTAPMASVTGIANATARALTTKEYSDDTYLKKPTWVALGAVRPDPWEKFDRFAQRGTTAIKDGVMYTGRHGSTDVLVWDRDTGTYFEIAGSGFFGQYVSASSTKLAVGARYNSNYSGRVYIYDTANLSPTSTPIVLQHTYGDFYDGYFGERVEISDTGLLIGHKKKAYVHMANPDGSGLTLVNRISGTGDRYGESLAIDNERYYVGDPGSNRIEIFDIASKTFIMAITREPDYTSQFPSFGHQVKVTEDRIYVGDSFAVRTGETGGGRIFIYDHDGTYITAIKESNFGGVGYNVAASGGYVLGSGQNSGVGVYTKNGDTVDYIPNPVGSSYLARFGASLAMEGSNVAIGASWGNATTPEQAVWLYNIPSYYIKDDGSVTMAITYTPTTKESVATKGYTDTEIRSYMLSAEFGLSLPTIQPTVAGTPWNNAGNLEIFM